MTFIPQAQIKYNKPSKKPEMPIRTLVDELFSSGKYDPKTFQKKIFNEYHVVEIPELHVVSTLVDRIDCVCINEDIFRMGDQISREKGSVTCVFTSKEDSEKLVRFDIIPVLDYLDLLIKHHTPEDSIKLLKQYGYTFVENTIPSNMSPADMSKISKNNVQFLDKNGWNLEVDTWVFTHEIESKIFDNLIKKSVREYVNDVPEINSLLNAKTYQIFLSKTPDSTMQLFMKLLRDANYHVVKLKDKWKPADLSSLGTDMQDFCHYGHNIWAFTHESDFIQFKLVNE